MAIFSYQCDPADAVSLAETARRCEQAGFEALLAADHPGSCASPFVALGAAAAVTSTLQLGSYVSNAGVREPMLLAADVATLDVLSGGRARLGLGAGHTPAEWAAIGRSRPDVAGRVSRCVAVAKAVRSLLDGAEVTVDGPEVTMRAARLESPRPVRRIPLTVGTANSRLLRWAGAHADVVGLSGFGRTLPDGHRHEARWRSREIEAQVQHVAEGAAGRDDPPELEALVQHVAITDDAGSVLAGHAERLRMSAEELRAAPFLLVGTASEIMSAVQRNRLRWGITRYVVRGAALQSIAPLLPALAPC